LAHPLTAGLDLDDHASIGLLKRIIASKRCVKAIYADWHGILAEELPEGKALPWSWVPAGRGDRF
jgi:hypothetical protein